MRREIGRLRFGSLLLAGALAVGSGLAPSSRAAVDVRRDAVVEAVEKVMPSVVNIATETIVQVRDPFERLFREFWDPYHRRQSKQYSLGSGVIIDEAGYVLTNDHVVRRASRIWIKLSTGTNVYEAKVVAADGKSDVALLKLQAPTEEKFSAIKFAADDDLLLGETVLALGNPFGLGGSVSRGILSSKSRVIAAEDQPLDVPNWLQTDASVNFGNSGGPLVNLRGELIGLNVAILREAQGIGFAIPVKRVLQALSEMFTPEATKGLWFGARVRVGGLPLVVSAVEPESPAGKAGLKTGDILVQVNGKPSRGFIEFNELLIASDKRDVSLTVLRSGERRTLNLRLLPESTFFNAALIQRKLGISFQEVTPQLASALGLSATDGLVIAGIDRNAPAARILQHGWLVTAIEGQRPANLTQAAKLVYPKKKGEEVQLAVVEHQQRGSFFTYRQGVVSVVVRE